MIGLPVLLIAASRSVHPRAYHLAPCPLTHLSYKGRDTLGCRSRCIFAGSGWPACLQTPTLLACTGASTVLCSIAQLQAHA